MPVAGALTGLKARPSPALEGLVDENAAVHGVLQTADFGLGRLCSQCDPECGARGEVPGYEGVRLRSAFLS